MADAEAFGMYVESRAQPGQRDALLSVLSEAADVVARLAESGMCLVGAVREDDESVCVVEAWTSEAAHGRSLERDDVRAVVQRGMPLIAGAGRRVAFTPAS